MYVDYELLYRLLTRCGEIAGEVGTAASVKLVHSEIVAAPAAIYVAAHDAEGPAITARTQAHEVAARTLEALDGPYKEARTLAGAFVAGVVLPDTLKSASTDTDRANAIRALQRLLKDHHGEKWVDAVDAGPFAGAAQPALQALDAAVAADTALLNAQTACSVAYEPAYKAMLKMKEVVRDAMGRQCSAYRRLRIPRGRAAKQADPAAAPSAAPAKPALTAPDGTGASAAPAPAAAPTPEPAPGGK
jgi:hypothetical protein